MASSAAPDRFETMGRRAFYRPVGVVSSGDAANMISRAIAYARERRISELLVNVSALTGFGPPNVVDRYFLTEKWGDIASGRLRVVLVVRAEMIHPDKFGVTVAANRGFVFEVFETEAEALAWLDDAAGPDAR